MTTQTQKGVGRGFDRGNFAPICDHCGTKCIWSEMETIETPVDILVLCNTCADTEREYAVSCDD